MALSGDQIRIDTAISNINKSQFNSNNLASAVTIDRMHIQREQRFRTFCHETLNILALLQSATNNLRYFQNNSNYQANYFDKGLYDTSVLKSQWILEIYSAQNMDFYSVTFLLNQILCMTKARQKAINIQPQESTKPKQMQNIRSTQFFFRNW